LSTTSKLWLVGRTANLLLLLLLLQYTYVALASSVTELQTLQAASADVHSSCCLCFCCCCWLLLPAPGELCKGAKSTLSTTSRLWLVTTAANLLLLKYIDNAAARAVATGCRWVECAIE
jgi:hypothetical protein